MSSGTPENVIYELFVYKSHIQCLFKQDLALNNLQELICHETQPTNRKFVNKIFYK